VCLTPILTPVARRPPIVLVHDYLTQRGGAERVVLSMLKAFPGAPLYTSLYDAPATFADFRDADVRTLALDRIELLRRHHRAAFPLLAPAFGRLRLDADVVLCSSSGWAHGAQAAGRKLVYCYTPARWLYQGNLYARGRSPAVKLALRAARGRLVRWDLAAARTADVYLTSSAAVRERIRDAYGIEAEIVPPPETLSTGEGRAPVPALEPGFFVCVSRLMPYKNVDAVVAAFGALAEERLVVVGTGPEEARLRQLGGGNIRFLGAVGDDEMRWLYDNSDGLIAASYEDYGLSPLEAAAYGKPAAVLRFGGFLDTVVSERTGVFFDRPVASDIAEAVRRLRRLTWSAPDLIRHARMFSEDRFVERLREVVAEGRGEATV